MALLQIYQDSKGRGTCRSCGAAILWAELTSGKRAPFDGDEFMAIRIEGGLIDGQRVIEHIDSTINKSHFSSCPNAARHRRR